MTYLPDTAIGGAVVKRMFAGHRAGDILSREQVLAMPGANRNALVNIGKIVLFPLRADAFEQTATDYAPEINHGAEHHVVSRGFGKFDVIAGLRLNSEPLDKEAAYALAGLPPPEPVTEKPRRKKH